jgi:hypothetical protein
MYHLFAVGRDRLRNRHAGRGLSMDLETFVIRWRTQVQNRAEVNPAILAYWLFFIAPSCVFSRRLGPDSSFRLFTCAFPSCRTPCTAQASLIRHYREKHHDYMPLDIFGPVQLFRCLPCGLVWQRDEHLRLHQLTVGHLQVAARDGDLQAAATLDEIQQRRETRQQNVQAAQQQEHVALEAEWTRRIESLIDNVNVSVQEIDTTLALVHNTSTTDTVVALHSSSDLTARTTEVITITTDTSPITTPTTIREQSIETSVDSDATTPTSTQSTITPPPSPPPTQITVPALNTSNITNTQVVIQQQLRDVVDSVAVGLDTEDDDASPVQRLSQQMKRSLSVTLKFGTNKDNESDDEYEPAEKRSK